VPHATPLRRNGNPERHTTGIFSWQAAPLKALTGFDVCRSSRRCAAA